MKYTTGDIWRLRAQKDCWIVIPTNTTIRSDGDAVMGRGLAKDAAKMFPDLPTKLGNHINRLKDQIYVQYPVICLPTKRSWRYPSQIKFIEQGCYELLHLKGMLESLGVNKPILLPHLGSGLGGLNWERQVRPIVDAILEGDTFIVVSQ